MGQGSSTNNKQLQKNDSVEQVESVESNEDDDMSRIGSLKKNKWLRQKPSEKEEKPKKPKKNDKKKKKKEDQDEVSSATCLSESDRTSLRHSRIELHLEECQPAPDEDDAISLSSCGEDLQKNLKDIESEERPSLLNCDNSSSSVTASPGESLSSGQDSGFARGNTIHSVSSEEEHTETNHKDKKNSSTIGTKLITPTVEVTEKCQDYIEKSYPFNSCSPTETPANPIVENQTKDSGDDSTAVSNLSQENVCDAISSSTVPKPKLETQSSITETPKVVSQTEVMKDTDLVTGMVKELVDETLESAVEYLTHEYKKRNNKPEFNESNQQESVSEDSQTEEKTDKEQYLSEVKETSETEEKSKEMNETHMTLSDTLPEPFQDKVSGEGIDNKEAAALNFIEKTEVNTTTEEDVIVTNKDVTDSLNQELGVEDISVEIASSTDFVKVDNDETIEKSGEFEELSYSLKVTSEQLEASKTEEPEDKSEKDANEVEPLQNCNMIDSNSSQLSTEITSNLENSMKVELSENESSEPEVIVETNQTEETKTICPSDILKIEQSEYESSEPEILVETNQTEETKTICPSDILKVEQSEYESSEPEILVETNQTEETKTICPSDILKIEQSEYESSEPEILVETNQTEETKTICPSDILKIEQSEYESSEPEILVETNQTEETKTICPSGILKVELSENNSSEPEVLVETNQMEETKNIGPSGILKVELSENESSEPEILSETNQMEEKKTICPSVIVTTTSSDAEDSGANNPDGNLLSFSSDLNDASMTENTQTLNETSSFEQSTPEIITTNELHNNCTDSSSGSAASPQQPKDSKETAEQAPSNSTQPIPDNTTGAVFV